MLIVKVQKGNINRALKQFKRKFRDTKVIKELREKQYYTKPSKKRRVEKDDVIEYSNYILGKEIEVHKCDPNDIVKVVNTHYPDIRKIINTIQGSIVDGYVKIDDNSLKNSQLGDRIVNALQKKYKLHMIRQILADSGAREFDGLFKVLYDNVSKYTNREGEAILIIAKYQYEYTFVLEKEICIAAMLNKLLDIC